MEEAGLEVRQDAVGNVFGRLQGKEDGDCILTGSHIDSVKNGGAYDGALGVVSGIAALEVLAHEFGPPRQTVEVVSLCEEEGSRFNANYYGTRSILGMVTEDEPTRLVDSEGVTLAEAAASVGLYSDRLSEARRNDLAMFLELHIEQSRILQDTGIDVGIVDTISGLAWLQVAVKGRPDHAGATAMTDRRDALQGAARMAISVEALAAAEGPPLVATTGVMDVYPGGVNIVPGRADFAVDVRHPDTPTLNSMVEKIRSACGRVATERGIEVEISTVKNTPPHTLDPNLRQVLAASAEACGLSWRSLPSGAGHDSQTMGTRIPTAMIFVPSVDGRSHSPAEYSTPTDCARGASVLATSLRALAW
jgi:allantoate deiminase